MMHIVLVNPEIPQNTGNIARIVADTDAGDGVARVIHEQLEAVL